MKKCNVGGQAIIEGVMMKSAKCTAMAVRKPNGEIEIKREENKSIIKKYKFLNVPFVRGIFVLIESLISGMKALNYSASFFDDEEEENSEPSKFDIWVNSKFEKLEKKFGEEKIMNAISGVSIAIGVLMAVVLFMIIPTFIASFFKGFVQNAIILNFIEGVVKVAILITYMWLIGKMDDMNRMYKYHGAEHKTIFCYENEKPLTVENVKEFTRFHPRCGTNFLFLTMFVSIIVYAFTGWGSIVQRVIFRIILLPIVAGITYEVIRWLGKNNSKFAKIVAYPGLKLQELTTREPDADQIEVAIASLKAAEGIDEKEVSEKECI